MTEYWLFGVATSDSRALASRMNLPRAVFSIRRNQMTESLGFKKISTLFATPKLHSGPSKLLTAIAVVSLCVGTGAMTARAQCHTNNFASQPVDFLLKSALTHAVNDEARGLNLNMWATIVTRDGPVCDVPFSGTGSGSHWLGSRVISAQKANT